MVCTFLWFVFSRLARTERESCVPVSTVNPDSVLEGCVSENRFVEKVKIGVLAVLKRAIGKVRQA